MILVGLRRTLNVLLNPVPAALAAILLAVLIFDAFPADSIFYHLPFSVRSLYLPGFPDFANYMEGRYQGFPSLWRFFLGPGLIWENPRLFIVPNLVALGLLAYGCRRILALPLALVACCCLCFPIALYGFGSSAQDFFVNAMVLLASLALFQSSAGLEGNQRKPRWFGRWDLIGFLCLALAANVKFQGLFMAIVVIAAAIVFRFKDIGFMTGGASKPRNSQLVVATILGLLIFLQPILNTSRFGNPFYPIGILGLPGPEPRVDTPIQYLPKIPLLYNPLAYIVSVSEIDPIVRSMAGFSFTRSWNNHNKPKPEYQPVFPDYPAVVTGGSNGLLFVVLFAGACFSVYPSGRKAPLELTPLLILRRRLLLTSMLFMFLPQSMELRYYLVSLFTPALVAVGGNATKTRQVMRWLVVAGLWYAMYNPYLQPLYFWIRTGEWMSARGMMSPDLYRFLPPLQKCLEKYELWGGTSPTGHQRTITEIQTSLTCHFRFLQQR